MKGKIWILVISLTFALVPNIYAGDEKEEKDSVFFGLGYNPSISTRYGMGHDVVLNIYTDNKYEPGFMQFRYTRFEDQLIRLEPGDVDSYTGGSLVDGTEMSWVKPRYELGFAGGPRVYQNNAKTKEVYLAVEFLGGSLEGTYEYVYKDRDHSCPVTCVTHKFVTMKESGLYVVGTLSPIVRIKPTKNIAINGKVSLGGGWAKYRKLSDNEWFGIWHARASIGLEFVF